MECELVAGDGSKVGPLWRVVDCSQIYFAGATKIALGIIM